MLNYHPVFVLTFPVYLFFLNID
uniref:Uncharacterized protein n=1 Tax=Anguilla anguilla TaxID=7936 RepID=A0A0E9V4L2_ANGAN